MSLYRFGDFELDADLYQLRREGQIVEIGPKAFDLLLYLIRQPKRIVSRTELVREVWHAEAVSDSSVPTCITAVRRALGDDPATPTFVETVRGRGYRFVAETASMEAAPTGSAHSSDSLPRQAGAFVGRQAEMSSLEAGLAHALDGAPQTFLLLGEAGIGKTRLLEEFARRSEERGAMTLFGRCREDAGAPAFWPWVQILRSYIEFDSKIALRHLDPQAGIVFQILPELSQLLPDLVPLPEVGAEQARFRLLDAMTSLFQTSAKHTPLVLVIDDLHRADTASLLLLEFLVRELRNSPIFIVGAYRDLDVRGDDAREQCLARVARLAPTRSIQLKGLSRKAVGMLVEQPEDAGLVEKLYEQSAGNPFFLTQLVQLIDLESESTPGRIATEWKFNLPAGVRDAIASQLDALPAKTREVLAVAAVVGRDFATAVIARALNATPAKLLKWLDPAMAARLIEQSQHRPGEYRFSHALLRDVVYDQIETLERGRLHRRVGESLEALYAPALDACIEDLAHHFAASIAVGDPQKAVRYCVNAGEHAASQLAHENAPAHFRRALELMDFQTAIDARERCELLLRLGAAEMRIGDRETAKRTLRHAASIAREIGEPELLARAALGMAPGFFTIEVGVSDAELAALLIEAEVALPRSEARLRAQLTARLAMDAVWSDSPERSDQLSLAALEHAHAVQDPATKAYAVSARHGALWGPDNFNKRRKLISEIGELARAGSDAEISLMHRVLNITALLEAGDVPDLDREILAYTQLAEELRLPHAQWFVSLFRAMRALMEGRFEAADSGAQKFLELGNRVQDNNAPQSFGAHFMQRRWDQNRIEDVIAPVSAFVSAYPAILAWRCVLSFFESERGNPGAVQSFDSLAEIGFRNIPRNETWGIAISMLSNACVNLGDVRRAEQLYDLTLPGKMHFTIVGYGVMYWGSRARELGNLASLMGRFGEAEEHFELAVSQNAKTGAVPWVARSQYDYARMLVRKRDPREKRRARELAETAQQVAQRLPMQRLVLETTDLIRQIENTPQPSISDRERAAHRRNR
jgi:DNA-binding winged helix-turn-helix (wHTH) protein/tetratricopeptide (TPR) repeat protein